MPWAAATLRARRLRSNQPLWKWQISIASKQSISCEQPFARSKRQEKKWVRRKTKKRIAAAGSQLAQIGEGAQIFDLVRLNIQQDDVGAFQPHLGCLDEQNSHRRGVGKNFRPIEDLVMQGNCERAKAEIAGSLEQLMRGVIEMIFRIVECVDVEIDFDPVGFVARAHLVLLHLRHHKCSFCALLGTSSACAREREFEREHDYERRVARKTSLLAFLRS